MILSRMTSVSLARRIAGTSITRTLQWVGSTNMIEVIEGRGVGSGKTYFAVERLFDHWIRGGTAFVSETVRIDWDNIKALARKRHGLLLEDDQCRMVPESGFKALHEHTGG